MKKCNLCEKMALTKKTVKNYEYATPMGIITIQGNSKFDECTNCGEVFIPGTLIDSWNDLILGRLVEKNGYFKPTELQFIFSVLPYSQAEIATTLGKERSTLTKYKNGENPIDPLFDNALRRIIVDFRKGNDKTMKELKSRHEFLFEDEPIKKVSLH